MSDEDVLTEEESDALLERSEHEPQGSGSGIREPDSDFWDQVAPDRIPEFESVNEDIAHAVTRLWAEIFSRSIVVSAAPTRRSSGRAVARSIAFEQSVRSFELQGRAEQCLLIVQPDTVSAMVDLCFGGKGAGKRSERLAGLTEMEARLFGRFADGLRDRLTEIWRRRCNVTLQNSEEAFSVSGHALCDSGKRAFISRFAFDLGEVEHIVELVWPAALVDTLKVRKAPALPNAQQRPEVDWGARLRQEVRGARIEVRAVIDGIALRLHQISSAKTGDIIMTEPLDRVRLFAGRQPVFEGTLGTHNGLNAVKISHPFKQKRSGDA